MNRRVVERGRHIAVDDLAAQRAAFDHESGRRDRTHHRERLDQFGLAAGDAKLFLGADHQIHQRQEALDVRSDVLIGDEAGLAIGLSSESPQDRAVVDVEHRAHAVAAGVIERAAAGAVHLFGGEVRAGNQQCFGRGNVRLVEVRFVHCHVGTVFAVENQREGVAVLEAEQHERGQALMIDAYVADVATFLGERFGEEAPRMVVADAREHRRGEPKPRAAERDIGRRAAEILRKARYVFESRTNLLCVEIHPEAAEADDVEAAALGKAAVGVGSGRRGCAGKSHGISCMSWCLTDGAGLTTQARKEPCV